MSSDFHSQQRALIRSILQEKFNILSDTYDVEPVEQAKNSHVFLIKLARPTSKLLKPANQLFTSPIPAQSSRLVFRTPLDNVGLENSVRVRNEVVFLSLAREALSDVDPSLIPAVFGWSDDVSNSGFRWILEEWKTGETFTAERVAALNSESQHLVLSQIADVVKSFQEYQLPGDVTTFGGLTFDEDGNMANTMSTIPCGGPFTTYNAFLLGMCKWQLAASERSTHLKGWRDHPKLRARLDTLFAEGLVQLVAKVPPQKPTLVHADLHLFNLLFDPTTYRLTAVLDFDFSHIGAPVSEYLFSFSDLNATLPSAVDPMGLTRKWLLKGFPKKVDGRFRLAQAWDAALAEANVPKPSTIDQAGHIADLWWFSQELCQAYWFMDRIVGNRSAEALEKMKNGSARKLEKYLTLWGF